MEVFDEALPAMRSVFIGQTVGIIFSQITAGTQNSPETIKANFDAIEKTGCESILIIISDVLNEPMLPLNHTAPDPMRARRIKAFELGINFLKNPQILKLILSLKLPFKILSAVQLIYEDIPFVELESLFCRAVNANECDMQHEITTTQSNLEFWAEGVRKAFEDRVVTPKRSYLTKYTQASLRAERIEPYRGVVNRLVKDVKRRAHNQNIPEKDIREFINGEAAFSVLLGEYNKEALERNGKKAFSFLVYTGGKPNRPLEDIRKQVVPEPYRWEQYYLPGNSSVLVEVDSARQYSPDLSVKEDESPEPIYELKPLKFKPRSGSFSAPTTSRTEGEGPPDTAREKSRKPLGRSETVTSKAALLGTWGTGHRDLKVLTGEAFAQNPKTPPASLPMPSLLKVRPSRSDPDIKTVYPVLIEEEGEQDMRNNNNLNDFTVNKSKKAKVVVFFINPFYVASVPDFYKTIREYFKTFQQVRWVKIRIVFFDIHRVDLNSKKSLERNIDTCVEILKVLASDILGFKFPYQIVLGSLLVFDMYHGVDINIRRLFKGSEQQVSLNLDAMAMKLKQCIPDDVDELILNQAASELFNTVKRYLMDNIDGFKNAVNAFFKREANIPHLRESYHALCLLMSTLYLMMKEMDTSHTIHCHQPLPNFLQCLSKGPHLLNNVMPNFDKIQDFFKEFTVVMPNPQLIGMWSAKANNTVNKTSEPPNPAVKFAEVERVTDQIMSLLNTLKDPHSAQLVLQALVNQMSNLPGLQYSSSQSQTSHESSRSSMEL